MIEEIMDANLDAELDTELEADLDLELNTEVEIVSQAEGRQRQITAKIWIPRSVEQVWQILTSYDELAEFIPSLTQSRQIEHPQGGIRIEQIGSEALLRIKFCARVVLDMVEQFPNQIDFEMVEGDFKQFCGSWMLQPANGGTDLCYTVSIVPPRAMPVGLVERKLKSGLVANLTAIRQRAELCSGTAG